MDSFEIKKESKNIDEFLKQDILGFRSLTAINKISDNDIFQRVNICLFEVEPVLDGEEPKTYSVNLLEKFKYDLQKVKSCFIRYATKIIESEYGVNCFKIYLSDGALTCIFDTPWKSELDRVIDIFAKLNSLVRLINFKCLRNNLPKIKIKSAMDYRESVFVRLNSGEVVMDGSVFKDIKNIMAYSNNSLVVMPFIVKNLNEYNASLFQKIDTSDNGILYETKKYDVYINNFIGNEYE